MKRFSRYVAVVAFALVSTVASAAVPVAEWTDFNNLTSGDYTWVKDASCTVNSDGSLTIGSAGGLTMALAAGKTICDNKAVTIVAEISGLAKGSAKRSVFDISCAGNRVGLTMFTDGVCYQTWNLNNGYNNTGAVDSSPHVVVFAYNSTGGAMTSIDGVKKCEAGNLRTDKGLDGLCIGCYNGGDNVATGMTISKLALYDEKVVFDDIGESVEHWYKYDGDMTSYGRTALGVNGANSNYIGSPRNRAYLINVSRPYGGNLALGTNSWAVGCYARGASNASTTKKRIFWSFGNNNNGSSFGLAMTDDTHVEIFLKNTGSLLSVAVPNATTQYHYYVVAKDAASDTYSLYVDGAKKGTSAATSFTLSANYQWGSAFGSVPSGYDFGDGISFDDWRLWQDRPSDAQIKKLAELYPASGEIDAVATHRYAFNGNLDSWGSSALTISGENAASYEDSGHVQAYKTIDGSAHPYGSGFDYNTNIWTFVTFARSPDVAGRVFWAVGKRDNGILGLAAAGDGKVKVVKTTGNVAATALITSDKISDFTSKYHLYVMTYSDSVLKLYVDGVLQSQSYSGSDATMPNGSWQLGAVNGGFGNTGLSRGGVCVDEWRYYKGTAFDAAQVATLATGFPPWRNEVAVTFTPPVASDWTGKTLPSVAVPASVTVSPTAFGGDGAYLQALASGDATVALVSKSISAASIYGLVATDGGAGAGAINRDVYLMVTNGNVHLVSGGEDAGWSSSEKTIPTGNLLTQVGGNVQADYVFGAGRGGGGSGVLAEVKGNVGVTIEGDAQVLGSAAAGWSSAHMAKPKVSGNTSMLVKNVQTRPSNPVSGQNGMENGWLVGGSIHETNGGGGDITGDTSVTVDLPDDAEGSFVPWLVGGSSKGDNGYNNMWVGGNSSVTVSAPEGVTFAGGIIGGGRSTGGNENKTDGNASVTLNGGTYTNVVCAGGYGQAIVGGDATLTLNGGTFSNATVTAGNANGAKSLAVNANIILEDTEIAGFENWTIADGKTLTLAVNADKALALPTVGSGAVVKTGAGTLSTTVPTGLSGCMFTLNAGALKFTLTESQITATEPFKLFMSDQTAEELQPRIVAVNESGLDIPGEVSVKDSVVYFLPTVDFFTRTVAAGGSFDWEDSGWTKNGVADQKYELDEGKVANVTVTVGGDVTVRTVASPNALGGLKFEKESGVESANVVVKLTPPNPPTGSSTNVTYEVFSVSPILADGVTAEYVLGLATDKYVSSYSESARSFIAAKRPDHGLVSIKIGPRGVNDGYIARDFENVGALPLSGLLWTNALIYTETTQQDPGYTDLGWIDDANGSGRKIRYAFRGPNTYWSASDSSTGNAVLTKTYVDDGDSAANRTWTITNANDKTDFVTLPAAPNKRGWQIHLDNIPYKAYDVYFITASDRSASDLKETPIYLSADGGTNWVAYTGDTVNHTTILGTGNWKGEPFQAGELTEGLNYLKMRVSGTILGSASVATLEITHGLRDTGNNVRSGLAAIQVVEIEDDGSYALVGEGKWTTDSIWKSAKGVGKWKSSNDSYATISSTGDVKYVEVDADVLAKKVTLTGTKDFTLCGSGKIVSGVDVSQYSGVLTLSVKVDGVISCGSAGRAKFDVAEDASAYPYSINGTLTVTKSGAGTLAYDFVPPYALDVMEGAVSFANVAPTLNVALAAGTTLELHVDEGKTVTCAAVISGAGKVVKTGTGVLVMSAQSTYAGGTEIREGEVRYGSSQSVLGKYSVNATDWSTNVVVKAGASLDVNGFYDSTYVVELEAGAIFRNSSSSSVPAGKRQTKSIVLSGNATANAVGGFGIHNGGNALTRIDIGVHTLTKTGAGAFEIVNASILGSGTILVNVGQLWCNTKGSVANDATVVLGDGQLNLSAGFLVGNVKAEKDTAVLGSGTLTVKKTLDVSAAMLTIGNLSLPDGTTLSGTGLVVTNALNLGKVLRVNVAAPKEGMVIANVPVGASIGSTEVVFNGKSGYELYMNPGSTELRVKEKGAISVELTIDSQQTIAGENFESLEVYGSVTNFNGMVEGGETNVCIVAVAGDGTAVTQKFEYTSGTAGAFTNRVDGLKAGESYAVSAWVEITHAKVTTTGGEADFVTARPVEGWIDEYAATFAGVVEGTGIWSGTDNTAFVRDDVIAFTNSWEWIAEFLPTNDARTVRASFIKDIRYKMSFDCPGLYSYEESPAVPEDWFAAVTVMADIDDTFRFAVVSNGVWVGVAHSAELDRVYELVIRVDCKSTNVIYSVVDEKGGLLPLAICPFGQANEEWVLPIAGSGSVSEIKGICQDANLFSVGDGEYEDFDAARAAAGETRDIVPLWDSRFVVSGDGGTFRVSDTNGFLTLLWRKWHHYLDWMDGKVKVYRYLSGNNWIEYADAVGVETNAVGDFVVLTPEGLAWIAESATNGWFRGVVALGNDIDLSSKNWTPVAQFTGVFDGGGFVIRGLNNTNVVDDPLLGELGHYYCGPTNEWGYRAYGLFGSATNAAFCNVTFEDLAISNAADSVAALLGVHAGGDLEVVNVTNASGYVQGEGRAVAGLVTVGGNGVEIGDVLVTGNVNCATIAASITNSVDGGNAAQVLAGTTWGTLFGGDIAATNNVGVGDFAVSVTDGEVSDWFDSYFSWMDLPVCNCAPAVIRTDEDENFWRCVEANNPASVPVDPVYHTARMLAGAFANGSDNIPGWWMDTISAAGDGCEVTVAGTNNTLDVWETVVVDRNVTLDLNTNCVYGLYDCDVFAVAEGKTLTLKNGVLYYAHGYLPTNGVVVLDNVKMAEIPGETFYDRTVPASGLDVTDGKVTIQVKYASPYFYYCIDSTPTLAEDWKFTGVYGVGTDDGKPLTLEVSAAGASGFYRVRITDVEP